MTNLTHPVTLDGGKVYITQEFGDDFAWQGKTHFYKQQYGLTGHNGIDYGGTHIHGHPVTAAADGTVIYAGLGDHWDSTVGGGAHVVILDHGDILTGYLHLIANSQTVRAGQKVKRGHIIGKAGNTGVGTGSHLHFQVMPKPFNRWNNWGCVDPRKYMSAVTVTPAASIKPVKSIEDIMATLDKDDYANIAHAVWAYDQGGKTPQAWHFQKNLVSLIWGYKGKDQKKDAYWNLLNVGTNILNTKIKNKKGVAYRWLSYLVNDNQNEWDTKRLVEELAKKNGVDVAQIEEAMSNVLQAEMPELLAENAVDVEVTINPKEKI